MERKKKICNTNDDACDDANDRPVSLNNEDIPDAAVFAGAASRGSLLKSEDKNKDF